MKTQDAIDRYLDDCARRGLSPKTLQEYRYTLNRFQRRFPDIPLDPHQVFVWLGTQGKSYGRREQCRRQLRPFYSWASGEYELPDPMPQVKTPLRRAKKPKNAYPNLNNYGGGQSLPTETLMPPFATAPGAAVPSLPSTREAVDWFVGHLRDLHRAQKSINWAMGILGPFIEAFKILPLDPRAIQHFMARGKTEHHRFVHYRALNQFYIYLDRYHPEVLGYRPSPMKRVEAPSSKTEPAIPLDYEEQARILKACETPREDAMMRCLLLTGIRPGELRNLTPDDIKQTVIIARGKEGTREVPLINPKITDILKKVAGDGLIFPGRRGKMSQSNATRLANKILARAGVRNGKGGPRLFRHTAATNAADKTGDIFKVQELLGHTSTQTTERYIHLARRRRWTTPVLPPSITELYGDEDSAAPPPRARGPLDHGQAPKRTPRPKRGKPQKLVQTALPF